MDCSEWGYISQFHYYVVFLGRLTDWKMGDNACVETNARESSYSIFNSSHSLQCTNYTIVYLYIAILSFMKRSSFSGH